MMVDPFTGADVCAKDDATTATSTGSLFNYSDTAVLGEEDTATTLPESASVTLEGEKLSLSELVQEEGQEELGEGEEQEGEEEEGQEEGFQQREEREVVLPSPSVRLSLGGQTAKAFDQSLTSEHTTTSNIHNQSTTSTPATADQQQQQQRERDLRRATVDAADLAALLLDGSELNDGSTMNGYSHTAGSDRGSLGGGSIGGGSVGDVDMSGDVSVGVESDRDHSLNVSVSGAASVAPSIASVPPPASAQSQRQALSLAASPSLRSTVSEGTDDCSEHPSLQGVSMDVSMGGEVVPMDVSITLGSVHSAGGSEHSPHPHLPMEEGEESTWHDTGVNDDVNGGVDGGVPQLHGHPSPHGGRTRASWLSTVSQLTTAASIDGASVNGGSVGERSVNRGSVVSSGPFSSTNKQVEEGEIMEGVEERDQSMGVDGGGDDSIMGGNSSSHHNTNTSNYSTHHNTSNHSMPVAASRESLGFDFSAHMSHDNDNNYDAEGSMYEGQGLAGMNSERRATVDPADMLMLLQVDLVLMLSIMSLVVVSFFHETL